MPKFKVGDKVVQTKSGQGTDKRDNGKEATVTEIGLNYLTNGDGITVSPIGEWKYTQTVRGEGGFELVSRKRLYPFISQKVGRIIDQELNNLIGDNP